MRELRKLKEKEPQEFPGSWVFLLKLWQDGDGQARLSRFLK